MQTQGYKHGDVVALFMENNIDFFALWLGLSKVGEYGKRGRSISERYGRGRLPYGSISGI